jgi:flagellar assembly factor FliW
MNTEAVMEPETKGLSEQTVIQLPFGLLGFERAKKYLLLVNPDEDPFMWLQMVDGPMKSFLVISPFLILPNYQPDISNDDAAQLGLTDASDALVFNICTLRGPSDATINLKGPIIINRRTMVGKQVIPNNAAEFALDHPLPVVG